MKSSKVELCRVQRTPLRGLLLLLRMRGERPLPVAVSVAASLPRGEAEVPSAVDGVVEGGALGEGDRQS